MNEFNVHDDPYHHLHRETYAEPFDAPLLAAPGLFFARNRPHLSLDGEWGCTLDRYDETLRQRWFENEPMDAKQWPLPPDFSHEGATRVTVPGCINLHDEKWDYYEGPVLYTTFFDCEPATAEERVFVRIGAAGLQARVFVNGEFLGKHLGASTPFCAELKNLRRTDNRLQVVVDTTPRPELVPMHHTDWFNYGGLYRSVGIYRLPKVFINDFRLSLVPGTTDRIRCSVELSDADNGEAELWIPELGITQNVPVNGGKGSVDIAAAPALWSPATPRLYTVHCRYGKDAVQDRVGFRDIRVEGERILLNGKPVWLRGISAHEDYPGIGKAATEGVMRAMFRHARELGCNFMRLAHYPHHERAAQLADELGMLLWEEIPVYWAIAWSRPETRDDAENQLREMIRRDFNRASVIIWGVGNENHDTDERYRFMASLADAAKAEDATRLVSAACLINREKFAIEDRLASHLDVIGINEYIGWYEPNYDNLTRLLESSNPGKPVIITETGADAVIGHRGGKDEFFTEDCQVELYRQQTKRIGESGFVQGMTPWILYDFRTERRQNHFQRGYNHKGLIDRDHRRKKEAFGVLAEFYRRKAAETRD